MAHPMPNSVLLFDIHPDQLNCQVKIPLKEMQYAYPINIKKTDNLNFTNKNLVAYLNTHFHITDENKRAWKMKIDTIFVDHTEQDGTGRYSELVVNYEIFPTNRNVRKFIIFYDAVIHQVNSHRILVSVRQDWDNGIIGEENSEIGTIAFDLDTQKASPLYIDLKKGSHWEGFKSMVKLGMKHIAEGTDHLMFLLVLLLTAPLILAQKRWQSNSNLYESLNKILKITIAFTIGHSLTLILATLKFITFPAQLIEIIIAISIMVTAIHAIKPLFPNKENIVALIFGLIHGLAFSTVLAELELSNERLVLSLLGFNIGIEIMQLFVILLVMPWLLFASRFKVYDVFKSFLAILAIIASVSWIIERTTNNQNVITEYLNLLTKNSILFVLFLVVVDLIFYIFEFKKN